MLLWNWVYKYLFDSHLGTYPEEEFQDYMESYV